MSSWTSFLDGDPASPDHFNAKFAPLLSGVSGAQGVGVATNGTQLGSAYTLNFVNNSSVSSTVDNTINILIPDPSNVTSDVTITGTLSVSSHLTVGREVSVGSALTVGGTASFHSTAYADGPLIPMAAVALGSAASRWAEGYVGLSVCSGLASMQTTLLVNYSLTSRDHVVSFESASTLTATLPTVSTVTGQEFVVRNLGTQPVFVIAASGASINDQSKWTLASAYSVVRLQSAGTRYLTW